MIHNITSISIVELRLMVAYLQRNENNIEAVISDFGEVSSNNGYGTLFLSPKNALFKVFWIHQKENKIESVGLGGPHLGLTLKELVSAYSEYAETYSRYDNEYVYVFFSPEDPTYSIKIVSPNKLMEEKNMSNDFSVNGVEIILR